ncbi:uncharacterized protein LOC133745618 [Rosa rugosa]|uniref:uncharacterized protein LOC133745618 n=1 Tax=Rosa rugosa TaxID=74645 RepID=UPI002B40B1C6|nr:uncharacterized protein LOC133745618 [Rosa rugosa]
MAMRFSSKESRRPPPLTMQQQNKKPAAEIRRKQQPQQVADLTDFMNDMFFGTVSSETKSYNLTGGLDDYKEDSPNTSTPTTPTSSTSTPTSATTTTTSNSKMTQEWLEEARRIVASSPSRSNSPSRLATGSPRFAASPGQAARLSLSSALDRRDPLSRSARRHRNAESLSGEILSKTTAKHSRNKSEVAQDTPTSPASPQDTSPAAAVHKWFSNILKPSNQAQVPSQPQPNSDPIPQVVPPRQPGPRRSRFQNDPSSPRPHGIPVPSRRTFQSPSATPDNNKLLSPPKNLVPSAHRRSISSSTCSIEKAAVKSDPVGWPKDAAQAQDQGGGIDDLNGFLKEQRTKIQKVLDGQVNSKARIVLSDPSNSTSTMVAAICYAWLLENRARKENNNSKAGNVNDDEVQYVVVPVMNVKRGRMWKQREAAWLFFHVGLDVTSLLFSDEVDLESLMMTGKLNILVTGQDVLRNNGEVGSQCTILTDNYCEDAYDLLDTPLLKKLLLAGILLDTQNLKASGQLPMTRDAEAVQLLLVGLPSNYRNALFDQLTQYQGDSSFLEALRQNYGKSPNESSSDGTEHVKQKVSERKSASNSRHETNFIQNSDKNANDAARNGKRGSSKSAKSPVKATSAPPQAAASPNRGKNQFFLAKWFGFGNK